MTKKALIVGATGIIGGALTDILHNDGWKIWGLARNPSQQGHAVPVAADLLDPGGLADAFAGLDPTHVFIASWLRQTTEAENIRVNSAMVKNLLDALRPAGSVRHVALVTGLKHYLGPFEAYGKGALPQTPFREEQGRLGVDNFYYAQEDEVFAAAEKNGFNWNPSPSHGRRQSDRQRDELGHDAGRLRHDLQGDGPSFPFPWRSSPMGQSYRHDRRASPRSTYALGIHHA